MLLRVRRSTSERSSSRMPYNSPRSTSPLPPRRPTPTLRKAQPTATGIAALGLAQRSRTGPMCLLHEKEGFFDLTRPCAWLMPPSGASRVMQNNVELCFFAVWWWPLLERCAFLAFLSPSFSLSLSLYSTLSLLRCSCVFLSTRRLCLVLAGAAGRDCSVQTALGKARGGR